MNRAEAQQFVDSWMQGWNAHDLEQVMSHFADDVVFTSPVTVQLLDDSDGPEFRRCGAHAGQFRT